MVGSNTQMYLIIVLCPYANKQKKNVTDSLKYFTLKKLAEG